MFKIFFLTQQTSVTHIMKNRFVFRMVIMIGVNNSTANYNTNIFRV